MTMYCHARTAPHYPFWIVGCPACPPRARFNHTSLEYPGLNDQKYPESALRLQKHGSGLHFCRTFVTLVTMKRESPQKTCWHCGQPFDRRGMYCSGRCKVAAWRRRQRGEVDDDPTPDPWDIDFEFSKAGHLLMVDQVGSVVGRVCAHPGCLTPVTARQKYCCNAHRQDAYRLRKTAS